MRNNVLQGRDGGKRIHAGQLSRLIIMKPKLVEKVFILEFWWHFFAGSFPDKSITRSHEWGDESFIQRDAWLTNVHATYCKPTLAG